MVPDTPLFFPLLDYTQTHSLLGILTVCIPLGVSLFLLFEMICRRPLVALLPRWLCQRIAVTPQIPSEPKLNVQFMFYLGVAVSVGLGALSHQIWDAFTHVDRWGTNLVPILNSNHTILGHTIPGYKLFQYGSTVVGLPAGAILVWNVLRGVQQRNENAQLLNPKWKWAATAICLLTPVVFGVHSLVTNSDMYQAVGMTIKSSGAAIAIFAIVYSLGYHILVHENESC